MSFDLSSEEIQELVRDRTDGFGYWWKRAALEKSGAAGAGRAEYCEARAFASEDGFYDYCERVLGYEDLYEPYHGQIADFMTGGERHKMLLAFRGSFKSSIATVGYITWRIGQEWIRSGAVNRRYMVACENMTLAEQFVGQIRLVMESNERWRNYYGDHTGSKSWTDTSLVSKYKTDTTRKEPTVCPIAIGATRTGFHVEEIICDDLEAERSSATKATIEAVWKFYRLLLSILQPKRARDPGKIAIVGTRWHYDDIYARLMAGHAVMKEKARFQILVLPAVDVNGEPTFPTVFPLEALEDLKIDQGSYIYGSQYLLNPIPESDRQFKRENILFTTPEILKRTESRCFTGVDFAFTAENPIFGAERGEKDYTVVTTCQVDSRWNYYQAECFRERCTKKEGAEELFRQALHWKSAKVGLQKYDRAQMREFLQQVQFSTKYRAVYLEWLVYPSGRKKQDRISNALEWLFEAHKFHVLPGYDPVLEELLEWPLARTDDILDALANVVTVSKPPRAIHDLVKQPHGPQWKHIQQLVKGIKPGVSRREPRVLTFRMQRSRKRALTAR